MTVSAPVLIVRVDASDAPGVVERALAAVHGQVRVRSDDDVAALAVRLLPLERALDQWAGGLAEAAGAAPGATVDVSTLKVGEVVFVAVSTNGDGADLRTLANLVAVLPRPGTGGFAEPPAATGGVVPDRMRPVELWGSPASTRCVLDVRGADEQAVLAAIAVALHRHSGSEDFSLALAGQDGWQLFGLHVDPSVRVRDTVQVISPRPADGGADLLRVGVGFLSVEGASIVRAQGGSSMAIELWFEVNADTVVVHGQYQPALYDEWTVARFLGHVGRALARSLEDPSLTVGDVEILSQAELEHLRGGSLPGPAGSTDTVLDALFARSARAEPHAVALAFEGRSVTYGELDSRANRVAHRLALLKLPSEACVGVLVDRSLETFVAILAILKAALVYVPLDPDYPRERLRFMVEDSGAHLVAGRAGLLHQPDDDWDGTPMIALDESDECPAWAEPPDVGPRSAEDLAYVIYTSGSTGEPKGVMVEHRSAANFATTLASRFSPSDRCQQFASLAFDMSVGELFVTWTAGATLVVPPSQPRSVHDVLAVAERNGSTTLNLPASLWRAWAANRSLDMPPSVRSVSFGGEGSDAADAERWAERFTVRWDNNYGPTEATVGCTMFNSEDVRRLERTIPMGRPIAGTRAYVLDGDGRLCPVGAWGELYISGPCLARGYLGQPDLTSQRFVSNRFAGDDPSYARMYRSGDVARWLPDGNLEFGGRVDDQVKIRGYRIELTEIQTVLKRHPSVREALVCVDNSGAAPSLRAYVVGGADVAELQKWVGERLPGFMVPASVEVLDELPTTANGKTDTARVRSNAVTIPSIDDANDGLVSAVCAVWREVFASQDADADADFFEIGGDSLSAMVVSAIVFERFGTEVRPDVLFDASTPRLLAEVIRSVRRDGDAEQTASIA